jgi:hypothetical protein
MQDSNLRPFRYERTAANRTELIGRLEVRLKLTYTSHHIEVAFIRCKLALRQNPYFVGTNF